MVGLLTAMIEYAALAVIEGVALLTVMTLRVLDSLFC